MMGGPAMNEEHPCNRCGRLVEAESLRLHTTRERLREIARRAVPASPVAASVVLSVETKVTEPPGPAAESVPPPSPAPQPSPAPTPRRRTVSYRWVTYAHLLCPDCHAVVATNAHRLHDHDRRRFAVMLIAAVLLAGLIWLSFTTFLPNWIAAFWRNGAGGR